MAEREQAKPLAPASHRLGGEDGTSHQELIKNSKQRKWIKCCACTCVVFLILVVTIIILAFTVFRTKDPKMKINSITIDGWSNVVWTNLRPGMNLTIIADVSMKNSNAASFKFKNSTTGVSYDGIVIGEVTTLSGNAKARRTLRMNATVEVMLEKIIGVPRLISDLRAGLLPVSTYTRIGGKVSILGIKKSVRVRANCTVALNINTQQIQDLNCNNKFSL